MKKKIDFDYDAEAGITTAGLRVGERHFYGTSKKHPDDAFNSSMSVGMNIAEARAYINMYNALIRDKRLELKGVNRVLNAMPYEATNRDYVQNLKWAILQEIEALKEKKKIHKQKIDSAIEARKLYINSRTMDKKEREEILKKLDAGFKKLGELNEMVNSAKEEE